MSFFGAFSTHLAPPEPPQTLPFVDEHDAIKRPKNKTKINFFIIFLI